MLLMQLSGLTNETALALQQTCDAITGLTKHAFNQCGFRFVLTRKFQSDNGEGRFGHIRQLSGPNYVTFISDYCVKAIGNYARFFFKIFNC